MSLSTVADAQPKVLFFCRGRGRGHAVPDIEIAREWSERRPGVRLQFASYSTGQATLAAAGLPSIDLELADDCRYLDALVRATQTIARTRPSLVISHEEFAALPAAKAFGLPTSWQ